MPIRTALRGARRRMLATSLALAAAVAGCLGLPSAASAVAGVSGFDSEEKAICHQINAYRTARGLSALRVSAALTRAASWMSLDMASHDTFDHIDSRGRDFDQRIPAFGYMGLTMAENLAGGEETAVATFKQFKTSPPHRRTMLHKRLKVIGIGRAYAEESMLGWYWSTTFGAGGERGVAC